MSDDKKEGQTDSATATEETEEDDSFFDDLIESVEEVVEKPVHWLFGTLFGGKKDE